jgi:hypothetical protein
MASMRHRSTPRTRRDDVLYSFSNTFLKQAHHEMIEVLIDELYCSDYEATVTSVIAFFTRAVIGAKVINILHEKGGHGMSLDDLHERLDQFWDEIVVPSPPKLRPKKKAKPKPPVPKKKVAASKKKR